MSDTIVVKFVGDTSQIEGEIKDYEKTLRSAEAAGKKTFGTVTTESKKAGIAMEKTSGNVDTLKNKLSSLTDNLPFAAQAKQVLELGSAVTGLGGAAKTASAGIRILNAALLASGIPLLIAAIVGLIAYFKRTDDGATRLQGVMAAFGATIDLITGSVVSFGEAAFRAGRSFEDFGNFVLDIATNIGQYLLNRVLAPVFLVKDGFDALALLIKGDSKAAFQELKNGVLQLLTGFENLADKTDDFIERALRAAQASYEWEKRMDTLNDKIRDDSVAIAENDRAITKLIIASKNKNIQDEKSLEFLDRATSLEKQNLAITLSNEEAKLKLIRERITLERESINQDKKNLTDELANASTSKARKVQILKELRSVNDKFSEEERAQEVKIVQIKQASDNLLEKVNNRRDAKLEEIFQNNVKRIQQEELLKENAAKQDFLNQTTTAEQLEDALYQIKLDGLISQKELLVSQGRDIVDIDKAILDLELQNRLKSDKEKADLIKAANAAELKQQEDLMKDALRLLDEENAEVIKKREQRKKDIQTIEQGSIQFAEELATGLFDANNQKRQQELSEEEAKAEKENDIATNALQLRLNNGLISQEQFNVQKAILDDKLAKKEAEIKKKQFQANKKAQLIDIAINTAAAIVKTLATLGIPAGIAGAAIAAALGLAQAAVVSAQPTPKFRRGKVNIEGPGTGTSDSILARISKGETVTTAEQTQKHMGLLQAIHDDKAEDYINKSFVSPALRKIEVENNRSTVARRAQQDAAMYNMANSTDTSRLEYYTKKNKNVKLENVQELSRAIVTEMSKNSGFYK